MSVAAPGDVSASGRSDPGRPHRQAQSAAQRYPRIHLAVDTCFAVKRWTRPDEWARLVRDMGVRCVEASTDVECDPFYVGEEVLADWVREVEQAQARHGLRVVNLFTGWSTYRTIGLVHPDARVQRRILDGWLKPAIGAAARLGAGLGCYLHALPHQALQDPAEYARLESLLVDGMAEAVRCAAERGAGPIALEQMYTPHQIPWTVEGARRYLAALYARSGLPGYIAIDTGHQVGQRRFLRPGRERLAALLAGGYDPDDLRRLWLGPDRVHERLAGLAGAPRAQRLAALDELERELDRCGHLFAEESDGDLYHWLEQLGGWSPIVHLQQTDGRSSSHLPFTRENNERGIVRPDAFLKALARSCERPADPRLPPRVEDIYLSFEIFSGTMEYSREIVPRLQESVACWRRYVPEDGLRLDRLVTGPA